MQSSQILDRYETINMFKNNITITILGLLKVCYMAVGVMREKSRAREGKSSSRVGEEVNCSFKQRAQDGLSEMTYVHMCEAAEVSISQRCLGGKYSK